MPKNNILYRIQAIDEASKVFSKVTEKLKAFESQVKSLEKAQAKLSDTSARLRNVSAFAIGGLGVATKFLYDFEKEMNTISAVTGKSQQEIKVFRDKAVQLGNSTQYTSSQIAELGVSFARAGYSVEETTSLLETALNMATAGNLTLSESADLMGSAIKGFGLNMTDATRVADVFSSGANSSKMVMQDFLQLISKTGAVSQLEGAKASIEELAGMFGILMDQAMPAEVAATGLGSSMLRMSSNISMVRGALARIGIDKAKFQAIDFMGKLEMLHKNIKNIDLATAQELFGMEHAKTMLTLLANYDKLGNKIQTIKDSTGASTKAQESMMQGLVGAFDRFKSAIQGVIFSLGEGGLTEKLTFAFNLMTKFINQFSNSSSALKDFVTNTGFVLASLIGISLALQVVSYALGVFKTIILIIRGITIAWAFVNSLLTMSFGGIMIALAPVILGVIAFVGVLYGIYKAYQYVKKLFDKEKAEKDQKEASESGIDTIGDKAKQLESMYLNNNSNNKVSGDINVNVSSTKDLQTQLNIANTQNLKLAEQK